MDPPVLIGNWVPLLHLRRLIEAVWCADRGSVYHTSLLALHLRLYPIIYISEQWWEREREISDEMINLQYYSGDGGANYWLARLESSSQPTVYLTPYIKALPVYVKKSLLFTFTLQFVIVWIKPKIYISKKKKKKNTNLYCI